MVRDQPLGGGAGEGEPEVLLEEALLYWLLAARTGHPQACLALGVAFAEGVCGLRADLELGVKLQDLALLLWWQVRARGDEGGGVLLWNTLEYYVARLRGGSAIYRGAFFSLGARRFLMEVATILCLLQLGLFGVILSTVASAHSRVAHVATGAFLTPPPPALSRRRAAAMP